MLSFLQRLTDDSPLDKDNDCLLQQTTDWFLVELRMLLSSNPYHNPSHLLREALQNTVIGYGLDNNIDASLSRDEKILVMSQRLAEAITIHEIRLVAFEIDFVIQNSSGFVFALRGELGGVAKLYYIHWNELSRQISIDTLYDNQ